VTIPTIGIGAGGVTDGQIIVINDIMGVSDDFIPKFVRRYFDSGEKLRNVVGRFVADVKSGNYPSESENYG
jgi:3-methyl-2-oxobutanoate hydroxymethyltransferase